tara:strand:+ start:746 stop:1168 length:423 start_codon:yes stop_codon:yes gene_type:complete
LHFQHCPQTTEPPGERGSTPEGSTEREVLFLSVSVEFIKNFLIWLERNFKLLFATGRGSKKAVPVVGKATVGASEVFILINKKLAGVAFSTSDWIGLWWLGEINYGHGAYLKKASAGEERKVKEPQPAEGVFTRLENRVN